MPFKSVKQRRYLHAKHPEIAARWEKEEKVSKSRQSVAREVATTAVDQSKTLIGSAPDLKKKTQASKRRLRKVKGRFAKAYTPTSDDPLFNHRAAERAFNLVMKMDEPTARMFTTLVVSDAFEDDINNNLETIQKALDYYFEQRTGEVKKALARAALNSPPDQLETFAKAYAVLEEISKEAHTPQFYGYDWDPSDFRRDPGSGRFMAKVKHTMRSPLSGQQEMAVVGVAAPEGLSRAQRAQFQDEYRQVASFLSGVSAVGGGQAGDTDVVYHLQDQAGNNFAHVRNDGAPPIDMLKDPNTKLVALEARPKTLTAGGAAFGLMGGLNEEQVRRTNAVFTPSDQHANALATKLATSWADAGVGTPAEQNSRLFGRLSASGDFLNQAGAPGSKVQLAGKFAQVVGQYGPEAERVIGPSARKTAYRYRGTEKAPDEALVSVYGREIMDAKKYGVTENEADKRLLARDGRPGFGTRREQARGDFTSFQSRRGTGSNRGTGEREAPVPSFNQGSRFQAYQEHLDNREPSWAERGMGTAIVADYLHRRLPDKHLYKLHTSAGNTPPSEGVIINSEGQLVAQAVGYGDDHYLPFNLKHLSSLKGGEYIRNRSVGGLTAEDVYTGLVTGARRVTVVSRSGTFSMEFEPDFRGGRRHNDKAKRMTARYESLLDAVQSGQVDRQQVPKRWKDAIKQEVLEDEYFRNARKEVQQDEIEARLKEFKENPKIEGRDEERAETMAQAFEDRAAKGEVSVQDAKDYRAQVFNDLYNMKEVRFRLNGIGYEAALKSLQEQFPYYIKKVDTKPTRDEELLEFTLDDGYVEPGRNRPTKVNAGYYGMKENAADQQGFLSASQMNYQRGKNTKKGAVPTPAATPAGFANEPAGGGGGPVSEEARRRQQAYDTLAGAQATREAVDNAISLRQDIRMGVPDGNYVGGRQPAFMGMDDDQFRAWLGEHPSNMTEFNRFLQTNAPIWSQEGPGGIGGFGLKYAQYQSLAGRATPNPYSRASSGALPPNPFTFSGEGYEDPAWHAHARPAEISAKLRELDRSTNLLTTRKQLSELTDNDRRTEIERLVSLRQLKASGHAVDELLTANRSYSPDAPSPSQLEPIFADDESMAVHLDKIHQSRYLLSMQRVANVPPPAQPARGAGGGGAAPTPRRGPTTQPTPTPTPAPGPTGPASGPTGAPSRPVANPPGGGGPAQPNPPNPTTGRTGVLRPVNVAGEHAQAVADAVDMRRSLGNTIRGLDSSEGDKKAELTRVLRALDLSLQEVGRRPNELDTRQKIYDFIDNDQTNRHPIEVRHRVIQSFGLGDLIPNANA